jgi:hypothetical protein
VSTRVRDLFAAGQRIISDLHREIEEESYLTCARYLCDRCAEGDEPRWMIAFQGMTHVWKMGNGHSKCGAGVIWEKLIFPSRIEAAARAKLASTVNSDSPDSKEGEGK